MSVYISCWADVFDIFATLSPPVDFCFTYETVHLDHLDSGILLHQPFFKDLLTEGNQLVRRVCHQAP